MSSSGPPAMPVRYRPSDRRSTVMRAGHAAVLIAIISACLPALANAQPVVIFDGPLAFTESNPCLAGELVSLTGRQTITSYTRFDGAGGVHLTLRFITKGQGSALTSPLQPPKDYVFSSESVQEMNLPANGTQEQTVILNHILIRKSETDGTAVPLLGTGDDFMMKDTIHFTVANGVPTATITNGHAKCL